MVTSDERIENLAVQYFNDLFSTSSPSNLEKALEHVPSRITEEMNNRLLRPVTEREVKIALFKMHPEKAPGPDGMTALFYQKSWEIIKHDLVTTVQKFMDEGFLDKRLNMTNICLIPKTEKPDRMSEFRPISLCNVSYKIISKILCERLKAVLPMVVSETQSAFVAGRLISDNILIAQEMFHGLRTNKSCSNKFMAIKTDMSKAYDRVEWRFIEALLQKLGFSSKWISWIMWCITSVNYKVLINGQAKGDINPNRGLRQGDPLSPYLFILCTEVLIANIKAAEDAKILTGLKVAKSCPPISHLLFADDSLFFCQATKEQCQAFLDILKLYEEASGQMINLNKSSIQFGHKISEELRQELHSVLGITNVGGMGTYLGLPESLGGPKCKIFAFLQERIKKRANGWSSNLLSKGGKEILIKSVLTATPTFVMSCFRLPKGVTSKITSAVAQFWWSSNGKRRGIHWKKWKKLCRKKNEGGLGYRVIEDFNTALLAKQLWRLIDAPSSLFARVFKGRYYRYSDPLDPIKVNSPSYGWKSIISARHLVNRGLIKRIGSGSTTLVWHDNWIPDVHPRPAEGPGKHFYPNLTVAQILNSSTKTWNVPLLNQLFTREDVLIIQSIPLSRSPRPDYYGWHYSRSGKYSVKSGYNIEYESSFSDIEDRQFGPNTTEISAFSWKVPCPPKIRHFLWQVSSGCLPVHANLKKRGINCDSICTRCGNTEETINHALFECPPALQTWALSRIPTNADFFPLSSAFANLDYLYWRLPKEAKIIEYPWILWYIWKARNDKLFNNSDQSPQMVVNLAIDEANAWVKAQLSDQDSNSGPDLVSPNPVLQFGPTSICSVDGSWKSSDNFSGLGWCYLENSQAVLFGSRNIYKSLSPLHAELEALIWAMECMQLHGHTSVIFLTDSMELKQMIQSPQAWPAFLPLLDRVEEFKHSFTSLRMEWWPRSSNKVADGLAKGARRLNSSFNYINCNVPAWFSEPI